MNESESNVAEWVGQALKGSRDAFASLIARHERMVYALAFQHFRSRPDAEDVAQESFMRAFRDLPQLRTPALFPKWLYGITLNVIREFARARSRTLPIETQPGPEPAEPPVDLESAHQMERVLSWLARLPEKYRIPLTLHYVEGRKHSEIGVRLGLPENTVRSRVFRARALLAEALARDESGPA